MFLTFQKSLCLIETVSCLFYQKCKIIYFDQFLYELSFPIDRSIDWLTDWLTDRLIDRSIDWLVGWLIDWLIHRSMYRWIGLFTEWLTDWSTDQIDLSVARLTYWLIDQLIMIDRLRFTSCSISSKKWKRSCHFANAKKAPQSKNVGGKNVSKSVDHNWCASYLWQTFLLQAGEVACTRRERRLTFSKDISFGAFSVRNGNGNGNISTQTVRRWFPLRLRVRSFVICSISELS